VANAHDTLTRPARVLLSGPAADALGVGYHRLHNLIRRRLIPEPERDSSSRYLWTEEDLERARQALGIDRRTREHRQAAG
jgi:DNA-binding transcriptional MerR regulator